MNKVIGMMLSVVFSATVLYCGIVFDTDIWSDDVGALAVLHAQVDNGEDTLCYNCASSFPFTRYPKAI
jgi:hypothetical protein